MDTNPTIREQTVKVCELFSKNEWLAGGEHDPNTDVCCVAVGDPPRPQTQLQQSECGGFASLCQAAVQG